MLEKTVIKGIQKNLHSLRQLHSSCSRHHKSSPSSGGSFHFMEQKSQLAQNQMKRIFMDVSLKVNLIPHTNITHG